jgi:hypothetical protein
MRINFDISKIPREETILKDFFNQIKQYVDENNINVDKIFKEGGNLEYLKHLSRFNDNLTFVFTSREGRNNFQSIKYKDNTITFEGKNLNIKKPSTDSVEIDEIISELSEFS